MARPMTKISNRLMNEESRFIFQGGSRFAEDIANVIDDRQRALKCALSDLQCILSYLDRQLDGRQIAWSDVADDIGDDIRQTINICEQAMQKDVQS